jgi:Leu/Phe-tRNA-protein transferase
MAIQYTQQPQDSPNSHERYQHFIFLGPPKFTQIGIFCLKIHHLATLIVTLNPETRGMKKMTQSLRQLHYRIAIEEDMTAVAAAAAATAADRCSKQRVLFIKTLPN